MFQSLVSFRLAIAACMVLALYAVDLYAFNCTGSGTCIIEVNGVDTECLSELNLEWNESYDDGFIEVDIITYKALTSTCFEASLDNSSTAQSVIRVIPTGCCQRFPARVCIVVHIRIFYDGKFWSSGGTPICLTSLSTVDSWPPPAADITTYEVQESVTFTPDDGSAGSFTVVNGSNLHVSVN